MHILNIKERKLQLTGAYLESIYKRYFSQAESIPKKYLSVWKVPWEP